MSCSWIIRLALIVALFIYLIASRTMLRDRQKYHSVLESGPLNIVFVVIYNTLCYLAVGIRSDPLVIAKPAVLENVLVANWYMIFGQILVLASICLLVYTVVKRHAIGGQDTGGKLLTSGIYSFSRHPVYLGIVLISLGISIVRTNFDGMLVFPLVLLVNYCQAKLEEIYDVGVRFKYDYQQYKERTRMFAPHWFWISILAVMLVPIFLVLVS